MRGRLVSGLLMVVLALLASGSASPAGGDTSAAEPPLYGVLSGSPPYREPLLLTRLHPRTLAPNPAQQLAVPRRLAFAGRSPDGRLAAFYERQPATLRVIDLETMRVRGELPLRLGKRWRIREAIWLTADRLMVVAQYLRGSPEQIVDRRQIVVVDPLALRVLARRPFANAMALQTAEHGGDRLVLLLGRGDGGGRKLLLAAVSSDGSLRTTELSLQSASSSFPALSVEPSGKRAFVITPGSPVLDVDLETLQVTPRQVTGDRQLFTAQDSASRLALRVDDHTLAVYGQNLTITHRRSVSTSVPAGLALLDTTSWQARTIEPQAGGATFSDGTLIAFGIRHESLGVSGRPRRQKATGIGLRAYDSSGALRWRRYPGEPVYAEAHGDIALVGRHVAAGPGGVFPVELSSGRRIGPTRESTFWLLPEPVAARSALVAESQERQAIEVEGDGEQLNGTARPDVTRVVAVLVDGSEQELELDDGRFSLRSPSPEQSARVVHAYAGEQLLAAVSVGVRCGGSAGPCAAARTKAVPKLRTAAAAGQADPLARVSNRGTRVAARARRRGEREFAPRDLFLLRRDSGRAVYRIGGLTGRDGTTACFATGPAGELGRLGSIACGRSSFPSRRQPIYELSSVQGRRGEQTLRLASLAGVAADGVAEIGLLDAGGNVIRRVPVLDNVYLLPSPPAAATGVLLAYDGRGEIVYRSDQRPAGPRPPSTSPARGLAGFRLELVLPKGWRGQIRRSGAGPSRALVLARTTLPPRHPGTISLALAERDPRDRPAYPTVAAPPQLMPDDVRAVSSGGRARSRFTLNGRQFTLHAAFATGEPTRATLATANRVLRSFEVGAIAVAAAPRGPALQRGSAEGVAVEIYRSGTVRFRFSPASSTYRQLRGGQVSVACLTFDSVAPWEPNQWGTSKTLAETIQFTLNEATRPGLPWATVDPQTEPKPPFDGCLVSGSYGRRWNDPRGQHSPVEIAFTATGGRFFEERAIARDLALFVRTPALRTARAALKRGGEAPSAAVLTRGLPARVRTLERRDAPTNGDQIGVWSNQRTLIEVSARAASGKRLFIELRGRRGSRHNLEGLAFVH